MLEAKLRLIPPNISGEAASYKEGSVDGDNKAFVRFIAIERCSKCLRTVQMLLLFTAPLLQNLLLPEGLEDEQQTKQRQIDADLFCF
jgi:hypothetical protein